MSSVLTFVSAMRLYRNYHDFMFLLLPMRVVCVTGCNVHVCYVWKTVLTYNNILQLLKL